MIPKRLILFLLLLITAVLVACGGQTPESVEDMAATTEPPPASVGSEGASGPAAPTPEDGPKAEPTRVVSGTPVAGVANSAVSLPLPTQAAEPERAEEAAAPALETDLQPVSQLTAGEVDDNAQWDDYLLYLRDYAGPAIIPVDVSERHQIIVTDSQGNPVLGAQLVIEANGQPVTTLRTHSNGRSFFFPRVYALQAETYNVQVIVNGSTQTLTIPANTSQREWVVAHPAANQPALAQLDVLFLIDTTGSMSDEIAQLTDNINAIAAQIDALPSQPDVQFGMVTYRDRGDVYLTSLFDFTTDVAAFANALAQVNADGGGDYPEDLNEALSQAVHIPEWRVENTVSLIFLVADAPPHLDYGQQNHYAVEMLAAAESGIKIYPIASSGLDAQGEYVFRQLAQVTNGRFIFLTYGTEGPGTTGSETTMTVDEYTVSALDDLIVQIIEEELSYLTP